MNDGKLDKAKAAKEELKELQNRFDLLYDLDEEEQDDIEDKVNNGTAKQVGGDVKPDKKNIVKSFVNIVKAGFLHKEADEADIKVYKDALTSDTTAGSEGEVGIGVTIPEDIRTDIIELRRSSDNLEQYVNVEGVTTKTGTRNIEVDAESTPFDNVDEAADFPEMDEPEFLPIEYKVKKKGGILKMTAELLEDTASNIMAYINKWIAKKTKATRNAIILKVLNEMTKGKEVTVENLDSLKDIFNEQLDPAIADNAVVITNQSGFNYLDKLKDKDGNYILQKDPTQQTKGKMLFGEYPIIKLSKKTLASEKIMNTDGHTIDGYKHPIFCGDLKEAVTLFDRNVLTIDLNDKGAGLWDKDMTGIKVRDRFDVQPVDKGAVIKGQITEVINGMTNWWWGRNDDLEIRDATRNWDAIDKLYSEYDSLKIDYPYGQFVPEVDDIQSKIDNINEVYTNYTKQISYGKYQGTAEEIVAEMQSALKQAGIEEVTAALQEQFDALYK